MSDSRPVVRTRFAPSPTGMLHIGGVRTALFSWLYAKHHQGQFLLRIEDTDRERSTDAATQVILEGLQWLGLACDGEPVYQSANEAAHVAAAQQLLEQGDAYRCYCTRDELDAMREAQRAVGAKPMYDGRCRVHIGEKVDKPFVVRFLSPSEGDTIVCDQVLGEVCFPNQELDDLILLRSDGSPTYNLAVVVDDASMGISHVVRGSDHLNNTPRQIQLYQALGFSVPNFAHIPLIHGADGAKMSKRHGSVAVTDYRDAGYLPDALVNYLARLGWSHGDEEVMSREDMIAWFDLAQVGKSAARFDQQKLDWLNGHYLKTSSPIVLVKELRQRLNLPDDCSDAHLVKIVVSLQERSKDLNALADGARFYFEAPLSYDEKAVKKNINDATWGLLEALLVGLKKMDDWSGELVHLLIEKICLNEGVSMGKLAQPLRIMLAGCAVSPPIDQVVDILGKDVVVSRIEAGVAKLQGDFNA
ncbi:MAG: glutamate--tRNA ligase [Zetaproteobacteria bacterium]|nr:glutamate--tRNA ligase [Zetaproteobacteria bacterium]